MDVHLRGLHEGPRGNVQQLSSVRHRVAAHHGDGGVCGRQVCQQVRHRRPRLCHPFYHRCLRRNLRKFQRE